ncbi:MAG: LysR family transcriptional regulator [Gammaproteobacteria bacterium]|nr:LysR family transcriptional regulator [Gammaproteobacteria bacterium]
MAKPQRLPPLQSLVYFEAAARLLNFTAAANELGTTQPAVSHRIGDLEQDLGTPLFKREHRGVSLTAAGVRLYEAVHESLGTIGVAAAEIRACRTRQVLTVATDFGFAAYWLMPRLGALRALLPELDVRIVTAQSEIDARVEPVHISILFGTGEWPGCESERLFPEIVVPVCSTAFYDRHRLTGDPAELVRLPLLHLERPAPSRWLAWDDWFALYKLRGDASAHDLTFNNYPLVIQAAMAGQGVALGWLPLVEETLSSGQLRTAVDKPVQTERGYFLVQSLPAKRTELLRVFRQWITAECESATLKGGIPK